MLFLLHCEKKYIEREKGTIGAMKNVRLRVQKIRKKVKIQKVSFWRVSKILGKVDFFLPLVYVVVNSGVFNGIIPFCLPCEKSWFFVISSIKLSITNFNCFH